MHFSDKHILGSWHEMLIFRVYTYIFKGIYCDTIKGIFVDIHTWKYI